MSLYGARMTLEIFAPDLDSPIIRPFSTRVSKTRAEVKNAEFFDIEGDPFNVVEGTFNVGADRVTYRIIDEGFTIFAPGAFNGYVITFSGMSKAMGARAKLIGAEIVGRGTTLDIDPEDVWTSARALFVNVASISFAEGDRLETQLSFKLAGGSRGDDLSGGGGDDLLRGGGGRDLLDGGDGRDVLIGDAGRDRFVLGSGRDVVRDFGDGADRILVLSGAERFRDLAIEARGEDVLVTDGRDGLRLKDVAAEDLSASDFLFA